MQHQLTTIVKSFILQAPGEEKCLFYFSPLKIKKWLQFKSNFQILNLNLMERFLEWNCTSVARLIYSKKMVFKYLSLHFFSQYNSESEFWFRQFWLGNCDIYIFIFCHRFYIMRQKFLKFERDRNATEKFKIYINKSEKLWNMMKVDVNNV